jgi:hypothetical protein
LAIYQQTSHVALGIAEIDQALDEEGMPGRFKGRKPRENRSRRTEIAVECWNVLHSA